LQLRWWRWWRLLRRARSMVVVDMVAVVEDSTAAGL
jgi:hypothetical protein